MNETAGGFSEEQKLYLDGFLRGVVAKAGPGAPMPGSADIQRAAQDRVLAAGGKLTPEEEAKRQGHPLDMWDELRAEAESGRFPKGTDIFRHKFFGLFYVAPAQNSFMCRLRAPNGILSAAQLAGLADIAERQGGGSVDLTTRANLQIRDIAPAGLIEVLTGVQELGLTSRGSGADNVRNITGNPTAGIDPQELIDTRPLARELHYYILNHRELYGLPRKFNIAFDGGGRIAVLEDSNDIGFAAVTVGGGAAVTVGGAAAVPAGVYFRLQLGGITGHGDFARDCGVLLTPAECLGVAVAVLRVFIAEGDRTDRKRARLKYLIDRWGVEKFTAAVEAELGRTLIRLPLDACTLPRPPVKHAHIGIHPQRQPGLSYIGVAVPAGRLTATQLRGLAEIARSQGSGTLRLTVWQNLLISDVPEAAIAAACAAIEGLGLAVSASAVGGGIVACTGNTGCKFAATDTKGQALALAAHLDATLVLDRPVNIHVTGCPHSCAQHYIGDIGLLGVKIGEEMVEGYSIAVGGGAGPEQRIGRDIYPAVPAAELPYRVERILRSYLAHRRDRTESFHDFAGRHSVEALRALIETMPAQAA